jgi:hypothetical protein
MFSNYDANKYDPQPVFELPPEGIHTLRVEEAKPGMSKSGNEMIKVTFSVEGYSAKVFHYFVDNEYAQKNLDRFFDAFGIRPGDFNTEHWTGRTGGADIQHEEYNGNVNPKIHYFVIQSQKGKNPPGKAQSAPKSPRQPQRPEYSDADENFYGGGAQFEEDFPVDFDSLPGGGADVPF